MLKEDHSYHEYRGVLDGAGGAILWETLVAGGATKGSGRILGVAAAVLARKLWVTASWMILSVSTVPRRNRGCRPRLAGDGAGCLLPVFLSGLQTRDRIDLNHRAVFSAFEPGLVTSSLRLPSFDPGDKVRPLPLRDVFDEWAGPGPDPRRKAGTVGECDVDLLLGAGESGPQTKKLSPSLLLGAMTWKSTWRRL